MTCKECIPSDARSVTGCNPLLRMGRDQTKGSGLLKAQLPEQPGGGELHGWLKLELKSSQRCRGDRHALS